MEKAAALKILHQLADGTDPGTGKTLGADTPYQHPDTVRALFVAIRALDAGFLSAPATSATAASAPAATPLPAKQRTTVTPEKASNSGKPWSDDEDKALAAAFDGGKQILELATVHQRSRFAIEVRLAKLGKIEQPANIRGRKAQSDTAVYSVHH
jgi:hypothetical protein